MAKIRQSNLDPTVITGQTELAELASDTDVLLVYDTTAGVLKKIQRSNLKLAAPTLSSVSPTNITSGDGTGNATFTITGTSFVAGTTAKLKTSGGADLNFDSQTLDSSTQITGVIAISSLSNANEPYDVVVTNAEGTSTLTDQINIDAQPVFNTSAGSVGSFSEQTTISTIDIEAYDPESAGNVTFEFLTGGLPAGLSSTTVHENGVSKLRITGTLTTDVGGTVTTNFTLRASDAASNTSTRAFSISETPAGTESFTSSGTFSVPSGITTVDVLVVGGGGQGGPDNGGGAGAGGLIFRPAFPVTPGSTITVTVGGGGNFPGGLPCGGGQPTGQDSVFGTLTAKGGGAGNAGAGGSGGGANGHNSGNPVGPGTQPTQPGDSGAYGFGNPGGGADGNNGPIRRGGGGGGAGAAGATAPSGNGGIGKAYTIADGTTPVYYAGGGGGGALNGQPTGSGGQGGGGSGSSSGTPSPGQPGEANKGGGGGGGSNGDTGNAPGGKGIVIVKY